MEVFTNNWNSRKYQIGYALSGGFIKGFAHLGVMQALLEHDIKPEIISGVSACLLYTSPSPRDRTRSRMPSSA